MSERTALRDQIIDGIKATDAVFRRIADEVRTWIDRFPTPWNRRVKKRVRALIDGMLNRSVGLTVRAAMVSDLFGVLSTHIASTKLGVFQRSGIFPTVIETPAKLGKWIARAGREAQRVVGKAIKRDRGIPGVADALDPKKAPLTFKPNGQVVRTPDGVSPHATTRPRTIARTETTAAHTVATVDVAAADPTVKGVRYVLSPLHPKDDECSPLGREDRYGMGVGVFPVHAAPRPPLHPHCMCSLEVQR